MSRSLNKGRHMRPVALVMLILTCILAAAADKPADKKAAQRHELSISALQFKPATLKIKAGDTVVWTNNDDRDHTVAAKAGSFKSENLRPGENFEHTFAPTGKFSARSSYRPHIKSAIGIA